MRRLAIAGPVLLLAACSGKGGSSGEDKALDRAAASLDANSPDLNSAESVDADESGSQDNSQ